MAPENQNNPIPRLAALAAAAVVALAGCQGDRNGADVAGEGFPADHEVRAVDRFADVQSAAAARKDGTLNAYHFAGQELNSLGREKLDRMTRHDAAQPLVVYIDLPRAAAQSGGHADAVRAYLADHGVADDKVEIRNGPNLEYSRPAKDGLRGLKRLEEEANNPAEESDAGGYTGGSPETPAPTGRR